MENKVELLQNLTIEMRKSTIVLNLLVALRQEQHGYELSKKLENMV